MIELIKKLANLLWCHRVAYLALAGAYGALCLGADKDLVNQIMTGFYGMLALQRSH